MPYGAVGSIVTYEFESEQRITDVEITRGKVEKIDSFTILIFQEVEQKDYTASLVLRTSTGLKMYDVIVRV